MTRGRYDLDVYHIIAVNDFNMGAMENKGLNVFNTAAVLAKPSTATDADFERVQVRPLRTTTASRHLPPPSLTFGHLECARAFSRLWATSTSIIGVAIG